MKQLTFILSFLISLNSFAGDRVWNGAGLAEKNVLWALLSLDRHIVSCLSSSTCNISEKERSLLFKILRIHTIEKSDPNLIKFRSHLKNEENFELEDGVKLAKTFLFKGSTIFINTDMLYKRTSTSIEALTIPEAVALLVHELGHHTGFENHTELDLLGIKVSMNLQKNIESAPLFPTNDKIRLVAMNSKNPDMYPDILLYFEDQIINVTEIFKSEVRCPGNEVPFGATFHNIYWKPLAKKGSDIFKFTITGNLWLYCESDPKIRYLKPTGKFLDIAFRGKVYEATNKENRRLINPVDSFGVSYIPGSLEISTKKMWEFLGIGNPLDIIPGN